VAEVAAAVAAAAGLPSAANLRLAKQETDELGFTHYRWLPAYFVRLLCSGQVAAALWQLHN
jgi:hypothetical protein